MIERIGKAAASFWVLCGALVLTGCGAPSVTVAGVDGVPLSELDQSGVAPTSLILGGPDSVIVTQGEALAIMVSGDRAAVDTLKDGVLGIARAPKMNVDGVATIAVTMPTPSRIVLAGSGEIAAPAIEGDAEVVIAGSGKVDIGRVVASDLDVNVMGSGTLTAAGTAQSLDLNIAGTGRLAAPGLKADRADINIAGSGGGTFASDGGVRARIAGSGNVLVTGSATCEVSKVGSGFVRCGSGLAAAPSQ